MSTGFELPKPTGHAGRRPSRAAGSRPRPPSPPPSTYIPGSVFEMDEIKPGPSLPPSNVASARASVVDLEQGSSSEGSDSESRAHTPRRNSTGEREVASLPPVDGGRDAWLFLFASTMIEAIVWGLPWSVGVLHHYWVEEMFPNDESTLTLAATLQTGLMYVFAALIGPVFAAFPRWEKTTQWFGLVVASAGLLGAAFVNKPWHLIITLGIFYPFAGALYLPCATLLYEWFQARRGIATGIMFAGTGVGGTVFPFIVTALLKQFGYKATMISLGIGFLLLNGIALMFIKRRIPLGRVSTSHHRGHKSVWHTIDWSFIKKRGIWIATFVILATAMGNFIPSLWIPAYAETVRATKPNGTALVALMNAASVPGNTLTGYLSDRYHPRIVIPISCALATIATLVLWGLGTTDALLVSFSIVWGFTALSFVGLWSKIITIIGKDDPTLPGLFFSFFTILKGVGNLTSGPISTALLKSGAWKGAAGAFGKTNYGPLLIYTGVVTFVGGVAGVAFPDK